MVNEYITQIGKFLEDNSWARIAIAIVCLLVVHLVFKFISGGIIRRLVRSKKSHPRQAEEKREKTLTLVINRTSAVLLWVIGLFLVLSQLNINWSGILAGAGLVGVIVGFGAQKVAGDFIAGFFILIEDQYGIGDIVEVKDMAYGVVERIDLRTTHIRDLDGGLHVIANGNIINMANHSYGWAAALVYMWFEYDTDVDTLEKLINDVGLEMTKDESWSREMKSAISFDRVEDYGSEGLKVRATGETAPGMQWAVAGEFRRRLKPKLDEAGVRIAYPRRIIEQVDIGDKA